MAILGFTGKMRSGKSTACQIVREELGDVAHINMKDGLVKEIKDRFPHVLREILLIEGEAVHDVNDLFVQKPPIMRALLQNYGTEVRRKDKEDYWVQIWKSSVSYSKSEHVVTDDVRFLNEAEAVHAMGGKIIRIIRPDVQDTSTHQSEIEMDKIEADYTITVGPGELDKLKEELQKIIQEYK